MNLALTPYAWEHMIQRGHLSADLLRPMHPFHAQLAYFSGWKVVMIVMWLPIALILSLIFKPTLQPELWEMAAFGVALWGGFLVRFVMLWLLGMITFWTTRVGGFFELYFTVELLFSGRLVPLSLMPEWAQRLADFMPFQWAFGFPIELLLGKFTPGQALSGLGMQAFWVLLGLLCSALVWRYALRRFSAVGA